MGAALALRLATGASGRGKLHGGGGPQRTIYYRTGGGLWAMNADGTNNRLVFDSSIRTSPRDGQTHGALISCSLQSHGGAPGWLDVLDDDPTNALGDPNQYYVYGTLYAMSANASGATTLTQLSDFDVANRGCALVHHGARWADGDAFISMLMVDGRGTTPLLEMVRFPVADLGVPPVDETTMGVVMAVPIAFPGDDSNLDHTWSPDGSSLVSHNLYAINDVTYTQLVLRQVATGAEQVLVDERVLGSAVSSPEFAPDGTRVAFTANGAIQRVAVSGGAPRVVAASSTAKSGTSTWYGAAPGRRIRAPRPSGCGRGTSSTSSRTTAPRSRPPAAQSPT